MLEVTIPGKGLTDFVGAVRKIANRLTGDTAPGERREVGPVLETRHPSGKFGTVELPTVLTTYWQESDGQSVTLRPERRGGKTWFTLRNIDDGVLVHAGFTGDEHCSILSRVFSELHRQWPELAYSPVLCRAQLDAMALEMADDLKQTGQPAGADFGAAEIVEKKPDRGKGPKVPTRPADKKRWQAVWKLARGGIESGDSPGVVYERLKGVYNNRRLFEQVSRYTFYRIVRAGLARKLDTD